MPAPEFVIESDPTPEQVQYLEDRLYEFNSRVTRITDGEGLAIFVRDDGEHIVAGICGNTWGGCCEIRQFWVQESQRGRGLGTKLLGQQNAKLADAAAARCFSRRSTSRLPPFTRGVALRLWLR